MPENNFEKKISSEMEGLKLKPSELVWPKVEERIRKKKRRTAFIIIFLFSGLVLLGWWQVDNFFGKKQTLLISEQQQKINEPVIPAEKKASPALLSDKKYAKQGKETQATDKVDDIKSPTDKKSNSQENKKEPPTAKTILSAPVLRKNTVAVKSKPVNSVSVSSKHKQTPKQQIVKEEKTVTAKVESNQENNMVVKEANQPGIISVSSQKDSVTTKPAEAVETKSAEKNDTVSKEEADNDSAIVQSPKKSNLQKWKWNVQVTPGISSFNENIFFLGTAKSDFAYANPNTGSGSGAISPASPSISTAGFAMQAGVFAQKQISLRGQLLIGLQYGYYSEKIRIGVRKDTMSNRLTLADANFYYRAASPNREHVNHYHFIEPSVQYHLQLNKNQAKPFLWNSGFTIGQLVATNAVMYDTAFGGSYYQNKKLLNETQFSLSTGFIFTLLNKKKMQWQLGPVADIHLNRLLDNPFDRSKYLFFTGFRSVFIINSGK